MTTHLLNEMIGPGFGTTPGGFPSGFIGNEPCDGLGGETQATMMHRLYWSKYQVCTDLDIPWREFDRIYRNGVLPRPKIRILKRGYHLYEQTQCDWLKRFFGLLKRPVEGLSGKRSYTLDETVKILHVEKEEFSRHRYFDFVTQPKWSYQAGVHYTQQQLRWLLEYFEFQESKDYDPSVNYVPSGEAHLWLGLSRERFQRLLEENTVLRPVVSFIDKQDYYYHKDHLDAIRRSMIFGQFRSCGLIDALGLGASGVRVPPPGCQLPINQFASSQSISASNASLRFS